MWWEELQPNPKCCSKQPSPHLPYSLDVNHACAIWALTTAVLSGRRMQPILILFINGVWLEFVGNLVFLRRWWESFLLNYYGPCGEAVHTSLHQYMTTFTTDHNNVRNSHHMLTLWLFTINFWKGNSSKYTHDLHHTCRPIWICAQSCKMPIMLFNVHQLLCLAPSHLLYSIVNWLLNSLMFFNSLGTE